MFVQKNRYNMKRQILIIIAIIIGLIVIAAFAKLYFGIPAEKNRDNTATSQNTTSPMGIISENTTSPVVTISETPANSLPSESYTKEITDLLAKARAAYDSENYKTAVSICQKIISINPNCYEAYNIEGIAYTFSGQYDKG